MLTYFEKLLQVLVKILATLIEMGLQSDTRFEALEAKIDKLQETVDRIETLLYFPVADHFVFSVSVEGQPIPGATSMNLTDSQKGALSISVVDKKGNPATLDGVPVWASSDETIATVQADDTGMNATVTAVRPGSCDVTVTGDADLGAGVQPIVGSLSVSVTPGQAVQITINEGAITEQ